MAYVIPDADAYINANCLDIEDWTASDDANKTRALNVAGSTLTRAYPKYKIPNAAVYEFANVLAIMYLNDMLRMQQQGVSTFGLTGVFNVNFKDGTTSMPYSDLKKKIPQVALDIIGEENGVVINRRAWKSVIL